MEHHKFDALILGAGAAGLMCALEAGKRGRRVALVEHAERPGKKILISGGGRCNFTNLDCQPEHFLSANPHFAKSALARFTPADFVELVEKHGIPYHEKARGQLFCDRSARDILGMLTTECEAAGVQTFLNTRITEVARSGEFLLHSDGAVFSAPVLVVATGGLSIPKIGATAFGYDLARQFGLKIRQTRPGLVPLLLNSAQRDEYCDLAGISAEVAVTSGTVSFRDKMLLTHRGLSGPAILQISSYWIPGSQLRIDLAPERDVIAGVREAAVRNATLVREALRETLPLRLATRWLVLHTPETWSNQALSNLERELHEWEVVPSGTEGYEKAEVTTGGVDTDELSSKTMECRKVPGLFFVGEVVDVTGQLGGYNFQWAWASGACAGRAF